MQFRNHALSIPDFPLIGDRACDQLNDICSNCLAVVRNCRDSRKGNGLNVVPTYELFRVRMSRSSVISTVPFFPSSRTMYSDMCASFFGGQVDDNSSSKL